MIMALSIIGVQHLLDSAAYELFKSDFTIYAKIA